MADVKNIVVSVALVIATYVFFGQTNAPKSVSGKRVLITGASSGIGEYLAYQYSRLGAKVFITARRANLLQKVAEKCVELGAEQVEFVTSDLGEQRDRDKVMKKVSERLGGLDILVLNHAVVTSGLWLGSRGNMSTLLREMDVNFVSYADLASGALEMLTKSEGSIGVVSSVAGKFAFGGLAPYSSSKFALQGFFSALRLELDFRNTGVSVTTCVIGPVDTDIMKFSEEKKMEVKNATIFGYSYMATPEDTANAIIDGIANRESELYYGRLAWVMVTLHQLLPGLVEKYVAVALMHTL